VGPPFDRGQNARATKEKESLEFNHEVEVENASRSSEEI
jgi:hypothetical protein